MRRIVGSPDGLHFFTRERECRATYLELSHLRGRDLNSLQLNLILFPGNPGKFILASMHDELKQMAQNIAQVPILYLNGPTPILEKPPDKAVNFASVNSKKSIQDDEVIYQCVKSCG